MRFVGDVAPRDSRSTVSLPPALTLANLEGPVVPDVEGWTPQPKAGPTMWNRGLPEHAGTFVFSLANNHTMDLGTRGLNATRDALSRRGMSWVGAGDDLAGAREPAIFEHDGIRFGLIGCCEIQFGIAGRGQPGVAALGPWVYSSIARLRSRVDHVIVSVHAGIEDAPWPAPYFQDLYRSFIDAGATIVHGHHPHVPQGIEPYGPGLIMYGLGNFVVDTGPWREYENGLWSCSVEVEFEDNAPSWSRATLEISEADSQVVVAPSGGSAAHEAYLAAVDGPLQDRPKLEALWQEVAARAFMEYAATYVGMDRDGYGAPAALRGRARSIVRQLRRGRSHDPSLALLRYHGIACESHRQITATALGLIGGEIADLRTSETLAIVDRMMPHTRGLGEATR